MNCAVLTPVLTALLVGALSTPLYAENPVRISGTGPKMEIVESSVPASMKDGYVIMVNACLLCHGQERILQPIRHCREAKLNDESCARDIKVAVMRNLRRPGVDLNRAESKKLIEFMQQLRDVTLP